jgi:chemotaxis protein methyltransferase CheR
VLAANGGRRLDLWSAAASTGQEAYSMAMILKESYPDVRCATVLATDLSAEVVARARQGRFRQLEVNRGLPARLLVRHFHQDGTAWQISEELRRRVEFRQLNLARAFVGVGAMDVVFLRNVLIYFDAQARVDVLQRVANVLRPGGFLFLGAAETTYAIDRSFERVSVGKTFCYRLGQRNEKPCS